MSELKSGIYKITINDYYIYIGQSVDVKRRWNGHLNELKQNKKSYNKKFQSVFNKYSDKIKFEIIEYCDVDKLNEREMHWIDFYRSYNTKYGLNMSIGGDCGCRKYRTKEEVKAVALERQRKYYKTHKEECKKYHKQWYYNNKKELKVKFKQWRINNKDYFKQYSKTHEKEIKVKSKQYYRDNIEKLRKYSRQWYFNNKDEIKECSRQYSNRRRRQKGIISKKEKFEIRHNLNRPLTDREWDVWKNTKNKGKSYVIKFLQSLPNLTFILPTKK